MEDIQTYLKVKLIKNITKVIQNESRHAQRNSFTLAKVTHLTSAGTLSAWQLHWTDNREATSHRLDERCKPLNHSPSKRLRQGASRDVGIPHPYKPDGLGVPKVILCIIIYVKGM